MKKKIKILQLLITILYFVGLFIAVYSYIHSNNSHMHIAMIFGLFIIILTTLLLRILIYAYNLAKSIEKDITSILHRKEYVAHTKYYPQNSIICKSDDK